MRFEIGVAADRFGADRFWLQVRYSDGEIRPAGKVYLSADDLLDDLATMLDGDTDSINRVLVRTSSIPAGTGSLLN